MHAKFPTNEINFPILNWSDVTVTSDMYDRRNLEKLASQAIHILTNDFSRHDLDTNLFVQKVLRARSIAIKVE